MFDIGFWELLLLFGLGLIVLGPERMPQVAAKLGRWAGQARSMARNLTSQFQEEVQPIKSSMDSMNEAMRKSTDWSELRPDPGAPPKVQEDKNKDTQPNDSESSA